MASELGRCVQLCCVTRQWLVTKEMIQQQHGCCGSKEDTMYVKRIKDISFDSNCFCSVRLEMPCCMVYNDPLANPTARRSAHLLAQLSLYRTSHYSNACPLFPSTGAEGAKALPGFTPTRANNWHSNAAWAAKGIVTPFEVFSSFSCSDNFLLFCALRMLRVLCVWACFALSPYQLQKRCVRAVLLLWARHRAHQVQRPQYA